MPASGTGIPFVLSLLSRTRHGRQTLFIYDRPTCTTRLKTNLRRLPEDRTWGRQKRPPWRPPRLLCWISKQFTRRITHGPGDTKAVTSMEVNSRAMKKRRQQLASPSSCSSSGLFERKSMKIGMKQLNEGWKSRSAPPSQGLKFPTRSNLGGWTQNL